MRIRYLDLGEDQVNGLATSAVDTVAWCAARMPFDQALAVADSALRHGQVTQGALVRCAEQMPDRYRSRCLRVAELADGRAANPVEWVLRAIAADVEGLSVEPQVWVDGIGRPDLLDASPRTRRRGGLLRVPRPSAGAEAGLRALRATLEACVRRPVGLALEPCARVRSA